MIHVIERCFADKLKEGGRSVQVKELIPSYGHSLAENAALCQQVRAETAAVLNINSITPWFEHVVSMPALTEPPRWHAVA